MKELTHYINGQRVSGSSGRFGDVFNPATGEVQARVPLASKEELDAAVEIAAKVQPCLLYTSPSPRDATLSRMPSSA